jgi:oligopeptide transport system substrate-binding protein
MNGKPFLFKRNLWLLVLLPILWACENSNWNSPYPQGEAEKAVFYSSFDERPKHLDPARSYSSNEWAFISQIYEPLLQYHFLKRPYQLALQTAAQMPEVRYLDAQGNVLNEPVDLAQVAFSEYLIQIKPGIRYQPHPAFARKANGDYMYWPLQAKDLTDRFILADFAQTGTRELVAEDYVYQIKRLAFAPNHSPVAGLMSKHIVGLADLAEQMNAQHKKDQAAGHLWTDLRPFDLAGVKVIDRYRFSIRINKRYPQFIYWLAMNFFAPMPWEAERFYAQPGMQEKNLNLHWYPVGTGPFMLTENNPNLRMVLERNPHFHGELYPAEGTEQQRAAGLLDDAGKPMPFIDKAVYSLEKEAIPRWNKFLQGYYDSSGISSDSFDEAIQFGAQGQADLAPSMQEKNIQLNTAVETSIFYMGFNMLDPVVGGNANKLRQAIAIAIDWDEFISIFRNGRGQDAYGILPPGIFGYQTGAAGINPRAYVWRDGKAQKRSIEEAKQLLAEAGYADGRDPATGNALVLYYDTPAAGPGSKAMLQWYTNQFKKLGIELVVRATDYNRFQDKMLKGTSQIFSWGWNADYPDPENFFFLLYGPNAKAKHHGENAANFEHAEFDRLFEQMKDMPNNTERQQVIDQMVAILYEESPWIFGFFPKGFSLHHDWYKNALPHLMANNTLKYKRVDGGQRAKQQVTWNEPVLWPIWILFGLLLLSVIPAIRDYRARERQQAK